MEKFIVYIGVVVLFDCENVDMDVIILKQFLKLIKCMGFGLNVFDEWCYFDYGELGQDNLKCLLNLDFVLNQLCYQGVLVLFVCKNFGCGSLCEYVLWVLQQYGFCVIIVLSFVDIFFNNCFKNGLLLIVLIEQQVDYLFNDMYVFNGYQLMIDFDVQVVCVGDGCEYLFEIIVFCKYCLLNGFDDIGFMLCYVDKICQFEVEWFVKQLWFNMKLVG